MKICRYLREKEIEKRKKRLKKASKRIKIFNENGLFQFLKTRNVFKLVLKQLKREKFDKQMKVFESVQITGERCGVCAVEFRVICTNSTIPADPVAFFRQTSYDSTYSGLIYPLRPVL